MSSAEDIERGVWRLSLLLTDDEAGARWSLSAALRDAPDLRKVGDSRLDRVVVQQSRRWNARTGGEHGTRLAKMAELSSEGAQLWAAAHRLPEQALEAWVLRDVERLEEIRAARAMDCSKNAMAVHLGAARTTLGSLLGDAYGEAVEEVRGVAEGLDAARSVRAVHEGLKTHETRRRLKNAALIALGGMVLALFWWIGIDLLRAGETDADLERARERFSLPMEEGAGGSGEGEPGEVGP